jgi:hypothetical protein
MTVCSLIDEYPDDRRSKFIWNVGTHLSDNVTSHPRPQLSLLIKYSQECILYILKENLMFVDIAGSHGQEVGEP